MSGTAAVAMSVAAPARGRPVLLLDFSSDVRWTLRAPGEAPTLWEGS